MNPENTWALEPGADVVAPMTAGPLPVDVIANRGPIRTGVACGVEVEQALKAAEMEAKLAAMDPEKAAKVRAALAAKAARDKQKKEA